METLDVSGGEHNLTEVYLLEEFLPSFTYAGTPAEWVSIGSPFSPNAIFCNGLQDQNLKLGD